MANDCVIFNPKFKEPSINPEMFLNYLDINEFDLRTRAKLLLPSLLSITNERYNINNITDSVKVLTPPKSLSKPVTMTVLVGFQKNKLFHNILIFKVIKQYLQKIKMFFGIFF